MLELQPFQRRLEDIYGISVACCVDDFVSTDRRTAATLGQAAGAHAAQETLFLHAVDDELLLSLFLDEDVLKRLAEDNPLQGLHDGNLADFTLALEGVSHFLYVAWSAEAGHPVSQLELELQAEVDKFVVGGDLLARQRHKQSLRALHRRLFDRLELLPQVDPDGQRRYREAHDRAARYCNRLASQAATSDRELTRELRRFYRLRRRRKLHRADQS